VPKDRLNEKQLRFCQEYIIDLNASQAAIRAGYSEDTAGSIGHSLVKKCEVVEEVQRLLDERCERTKVTADYVISSLREIVARCMQKKAVMVYDKVEKRYEQVTETIENDKGELIEEGVWEFDSNGACRALETLAKHLKLLTDKLEVTGGERQIVYIINNGNTKGSEGNRVNLLPALEPAEDTK